jgi:uncharacterized membrane protein YczE
MYQSNATLVLLFLIFIRITVVVDPVFSLMTAPELLMSRSLVISISVVLMTEVVKEAGMT